MRSSRRSVAGLAAILALGGAAAASADAPSGTYQIALSGAQQVWGSIDTTFTPELAMLGGTVSTDVIFTATVDADGTLDGFVTENLAGAQAGELLPSPLTGRVTGGDAFATGVKLKFHATGLTNQPLDPTSLDVAVNGTLGGTVDDEGMLVATVRQRACFERLSFPKTRQCENDQAEIAAPVELVDWTLTINVMPDAKNRLSGSASAMLGDGTVYDFTVTGKYSAKKDTSKLTLKPANADARGARISLTNLTVTGSTITGGQLRFRLRGIQSDVNL